jgi:hypothetical protein
MEEEFKEACTKINLEEIKYLLDRKQIPTKEHLYVILSCNERYIDYEKRRDIPEIINLFYLYGYNFDYDDVIKILEKNIYIENLYTYDIQFDNKIFELYSNFGVRFGSYKVTHDINKNWKYGYELKYLQFVCCGIVKFDYIKDLLKIANIKPDVTCLRNICFHKENYRIIKLFVEKYKLTIDKICISNLVHSEHNKFKNICLRYVVNNLN